MKKLYIGDCLVVVLALAIMAGVSFPWFQSRGAVAVVSQNGVERYRLPLDEPTLVEVTGQYTNKIQVADGKIRFADSDCPNRTCVQIGWIESKGHSAVCSANGVVVRVLGSDVDTVVG